MITDPTNEDSTRIKRKTRIFDHPKHLIEVLHARLAIAQSLTGNNITTVPNHYRFNWAFLDWEALHNFDLKLNELCHKTIANLIVVMNHVVSYFGPKDCLSNQKRYIRSKLDKPCKFTTRQYVGFFCDQNSRMAQMPPLFDKNQQLDDS